MISFEIIDSISRFIQIVHLAEHVVMILCRHVTINLRITIVHHFKAIFLNRLHLMTNLDHQIVQVEVTTIKPVHHKTLHHLHQRPHHPHLLHHYYHHRRQRCLEMNYFNQSTFSTMICTCNKLLGFLPRLNHRQQIPCE